jgi:hypothetical protein
VTSAFSVAVGAGPALALVAGYRAPGADSWLRLDDSGPGPAVSSF